MLHPLWQVVVLFIWILIPNQCKISSKPMEGPLQTWIRCSPYERWVNLWSGYTRRVLWGPMQWGGSLLKQNFMWIISDWWPYKNVTWKLWTTARVKEVCWLNLTTPSGHVKNANVRKIMDLLHHTINRALWFWTILEFQYGQAVWYGVTWVVFKPPARPT